MTPTISGLLMVFLYPLAILAYDAFLKFGLGRETISEYVWTHPRLKGGICAYLVTIHTG